MTIYKYTPKSGINIKYFYIKTWEKLLYMLNRKKTNKDTWFAELKKNNGISRISKNILSIKKDLK